MHRIGQYRVRPHHPSRPRRYTQNGMASKSERRHVFISVSGSIVGRRSRSRGSDVEVEAKLDQIWTVKSNAFDSVVSSDGADVRPSIPETRRGNTGFVDIRRQQSAAARLRKNKEQRRAVPDRNRRGQVETAGTAKLTSRW